MRSRIISLMTLLFTAMAPCWGQGSADCVEREQDRIYDRLSSSVYYSKDAIREGHGAERAAGLLRKWFSQEITSDAEPCKALACLVTLTELHQRLDKSDAALMGELYACLGDFSKAATVAENPVMKGFYKAVGKLDRSASSYPTQVGALLRQDNDRVISEVITERLKTRLAGTIGPSLLASPEFLNGAPYPTGLEPHHFGYQEGLKVRFLEAWEKAWANASITTIQTLFIRRGHYLKRAEAGELDQQVSSLFQRQPDALYRVAQAPSDLAPDWAPTAGKEAQIRRRMLIAKRDGREAEYPAIAEEMASHLASPRDCYEAVPVALKAKSETLLSALDAQRDTLLRYQGEGVSPETLKGMAGDVSKARGEAREIAAQRQKEAELRQAQYLREKKQWERFQGVKTYLSGFISGGTSSLQSVARALFRNENTQALLANFRQELEPGLAFPSTAASLREGIRREWTEGAGRSIGNDTNIPAETRRRIQDTVRQAIEGLQAPAGSQDPRDPGPDHSSVSTSAASPSAGVGGESKTGTIDLDFAQVKVAYQPPAPPYPAVAKIAKIQGTVVVMITIGSDGIPTQAVAIDGSPYLRPAAETYAMSWRFEPPDLKGRANLARFKLTIPYTLK